MKKIIIGVIIGFGLFSIFSYRTTDNNKYPDVGYTNRVYIYPPKQNDVIVTKDYNRMKSLLKSGYICQDVDLNSGSTYYTMIKY
jgi:hypothetical protein